MKKDLPKWLDYRWNPILFVLWSYTYSIKGILGIRR